MLSKWWYDQFPNLDLQNVSLTPWNQYCLLCIFLAFKLVGYCHKLVDQFDYSLCWLEYLTFVCFWLFNFLQYEVSLLARRVLIIYFIVLLDLKYFTRTGCSNSVLWVFESGLSMVILPVIALLSAILLDFEIVKFFAARILWC